MNLLEFHVIQSFPVSCLNRGEYNEVKTVNIGGTIRARVSSQCWKRAIRDKFSENNLSSISVVSSDLAKIVSEELQKANCPDEKMDEMIKFVNGYYYKDMFEKKIKDDKIEYINNNVIANISFYEIREFVQMLLELNFNIGNTKKAQGINYKNFSNRCENIFIETDMALFGRMLAIRSDASIDGAVNFAHAYSVNEFTDEKDYFSAAACSEYSDREDAGSAHLGIKDYCASTYYRYFCIDIDKYIKNKNGKFDVESFCNFIKIALLTTPSGSQTSMAARTLPTYIKMNLYKENSYPTQVCFNDVIRSKANESIEEQAISFINKEMERFKTNFGICADITCDNNINQMIDIIKSNYDINNENNID